MSAIFITATGTEIGKTYVAAGLIQHWRAVGREVDALKPVVTGFDLAAAAASDPGVLLAALGRPISSTEIDRIAPWRYAAPLSPDMAARREDRALDFDALIAFSRQAAAAAQGVLLIEGIGGVMVPLDERHTVLDWIAALNIAVLVVTGSYLGSLSHTLTALDALRRRNLPIKALVVNETPGSSVSMTDALTSLQKHAAPVPIVALARLPAGDVAHSEFAEVAGLL
jgi:dethiobiotin synthetase